MWRQGSGQAPRAIFGLELGRRVYKPHPKSLLMALDRMGGMPDKAIMVGDRDKDIVAARNAGMDSVLFCSAEHQKHYSLDKLMTHKPTYVINEFRDLLKIVDL